MWKSELLSSAVKPRNNRCLNKCLCRTPTTGSITGQELSQAITGGHMHIQVTPASNVPGIGMVMFHGPGPMLPVGGLDGGEPDGEGEFAGDGGGLGT